MKSIVALVLSLTAACAGIPSGERADGEYRRGDARVQATEQFEERAQACADARGVIRLYRTSSGRFPPTTDELLLAACGSRP